MNAQPDRSAGSEIPSPSRLRAWGIVAMLVVLMAINFADKITFGFVAKPLMKEFGLSLEQYGFASSSFFFLFFVTALLVGFISDKVSTKWILIAMALLWGLAQFSMLAASGFTLIVISRIVLGATEGPTFPLVNHASFKWLYDSDRSVASSLLSAGGALGVLISAPVLTYLIVNHGWRSAFIATGLLSVVWCLLWLFVGKEGPLEASSADPKKKTPPAVVLEGMRTSYWRTVSSGTFLASAIAGFAAYWSVAIGLTFGPLFLEDAVGLSLTEAGHVIVLKEIFTIAAVYVGFGFLVKWLLARGVSSRLARGTLGGICVTLAGVALILVVLIPGTPAKVAFSVISALAVVMFPIGQTVCAEITPAAQRGGVLGTYAALFSLAGVIGPVVTGKLAGHGATSAAGLNTAWLVMGGLLVVSGLVATVFIRPARDAQRLAAHARRSSAPASDLIPV